MYFNIIISINTCIKPLHLYIWQYTSSCVLIHYNYQYLHIITSAVKRLIASQISFCLHNVFM